MPKLDAIVFSAAVEAKVFWQQRTSKFLAAVDAKASVDPEVWQQWTPKFTGRKC